MSLPFEELTSRVLEAAYEVSNELGIGFLESVYEGALAISLAERGFKVDRQVGIDVQYHGEPVGHFVADLIVDDLLILELKAVKALVPEHAAQALNYLKASRRPVAMLLNFGTPRLEIRRFDNRFE
ncbi:MAG TPA: GxxExxY protein [Holophagaceae bacterium]|nr:GxxExxY protein [Holophagaceae bacterium]